MNSTPVQSHNLFLNAKGYAIVGLMADEYGIDPFIGCDVPFRVSLAPYSVDLAAMKAFKKAEKQVRAMGPSRLRRATKRGRELTADIVRVPVKGKEWAFIP